MGKTPKDKIITSIFEQVAEEFNIPEETVEDIFTSQFEFARSIIESYNFRELTMEEFKNTKKNFFFPKLFKLYASDKQKERIENINFNKFKHESKKGK